MDAMLVEVGARYELRLERRLKHPPEKVWRVLTESDLLHQWFPCDVVGDWKVGEKLEFVFRHGEGDDLPEEDLRGEVLAVEPHRLLEFRWGTHILRCELEATDGGTLFRFSENFTDPSWGARNAAGWEFCLDNLDLVLQGVEAAGFVYELWRNKFEAYVRKFEPEMGPQQGPPASHPARPDDDQEK